MTTRKRKGESKSGQPEKKARVESKGVKGEKAVQTKLSAEDQKCECLTRDATGVLCA